VVPVPVVLRADADPQVGLGHWARLRALAEALAEAGVPVHWATRGGALLASVDAAAAAEPLPGPPGSPFASDLAAVAQRARPGGWIMVDHYGAGEGDLAALRAAVPGVRVLVIDDHQRRTGGDLRLAMAGPAMPGGLGGLEFAPLRAAFRHARRSAVGSSRAGVVVAFGGADPRGLAAQAVDRLAATPWSRQPLTVIAPPARAAALGLVERSARWPGGGSCRFALPDGELAALLAGSALVVSACSTTALEASAAGAPTVAVLTADNQAPLAAALRSAGMTVLVDPAGLATANPASGQAIDGLGAYRVLAALGLPMAPDLAPLAADAPVVAEATPGDAAEVWLLNGHADIRRWSVRPAPIPWADHLRWWASRPLVLLARIGDQAVGCSRLHGGWVDIAVHPQARRRGVARVLLAAAVARGGGRALIRRDNAASLALFTAAGFTAGVAATDPGFTILTRGNAP
jgi:spore coat polysaccharide biosynthesis predicted glycosyltransferase SpsG/GNAT superfamily N-acetyltransferase